MLFQLSVPRGFVSALLLVDVALAALNGACPPLGPVLPAPTQPSTHVSIKSAITTVTDALLNLTSDFDSTGMSVAVQSIHEDIPMLEFHHTPALLNPNGTAAIDSQTVYRLGSISKIFAVLSLLTQSVLMEDPITKYVPELLTMRGETPDVNDLTTVRWDEVTVGSLASHMSGIGTDLVNDLSSVPNVDWSQVGLPAIDESSTPGCAGVLGLPACDRAEFFRDFGKRHPVYAPYTNPVYSNVASVILGFAVEAIANKTYDEYVHEAILGPLGMTNTTIFNGPGEDSWGFIPVNETWFGASLGYEDMAGGFYSNTVDLLKFGTSILQHRLLQPVVTRKWMKPLTSTSSPGMMIGAPWEIMRSDTVTRDQRLIEYYCKAGNLNSYNNILCLIPDYDVVITILSAGPASSADLVDQTLTAIVRGLVPAVEDASKSQAEAGFAGTYADAASNSTITLTLDEGPGFAVSDWRVRGVDIIAAYPNFAALSSSPKDEFVSVRLYPTNLVAGCHQSWRAIFDIGKPEELAEKDAERFWPGSSCHTWGSMDRLTYGFRSVDDFVFDVGADGKARGFELRVFKVGLRKEA
ncbi:beta-lactamase/transpeptidase-like protein [Xylariomycetidae sp. FL2044]|nr:beta-lactamase/transpeptidase-like protein [Xylariomycetidae sp. FL2044]